METYDVLNCRNKISIAFLYTYAYCSKFRYQIKSIPKKILPLTNCSTPIVSEDRKTRLIHNAERIVETLLVQRNILLHDISTIYFKSFSSLALLKLENDLK